MAQGFPSGEIEQLTSGPEQELGVAVSPDGRSLVTSLGIQESGVWMHTPKGDRLVSASGYASGLSFSRDGRFLFHLLRRAIGDSSRELWATDLNTDRSDPVVQGSSISSYDVSPDGDQIVFAAAPPGGGPSGIWLASRTRETSPRQLTASGEESPFFGPAGEVVFLKSVDRDNYLFVMNADGTHQRKAWATPIDHFQRMSPDRRWAIAMVPVDEVPTTAVVAVPMDGGAARRICPAQCMAAWSPDGTQLYVEPLLQTTAGMTVVIPVPKGESIPPLPPSGVRSADDSLGLPGSVVVDLTRYDPSHDGTSIAPGLAIDSFAYARTVSHRNLFRVRLP